MDKNTVIYVQHGYSHLGWVEKYGAMDLKCSLSFRDAKRFTEKEAENMLRVFAYHGIEAYSMKTA